MKESNRPGSSSSAGPSSGGNQPPAFPAQSTSSTTGVRPSFTVVGSYIPPGQALPPPTIARTVPQAPNVPPQQIQVETLLHTLSDANNPRIEPKIQCLREFLDNYDELVASATYVNNFRGFITILIRLISETTAQFIGENETHRLRKLILEVFQRMSLGESIRQFARELQKLLLGVILHDNEDNALLAIKIMIDHSRGFRLQFSPEITNFFAQVRTAYRAFIEDALQDADIFNQPSSTPIESIDYALQYLLPNIHSTRSVYLEQRGTRSTYTLIPRATHSIRVFSELAIFLLNLNQIHRQNVFEEVMELLPIIINFVCMQVPPSSGSSKPLVDEFHTAQIRALSFLAYIAKSSQTRQQNYTQRALVVLEESSEQLVMAINQLLENLNPYVTAARRDFIMAIKSFIESDLKHKFVGIIPRLISDHYLLEKFTSQDHFRYFLYHNLADLLYKIRQHLSYPMLLNAFKVCIRCIHDNQLAANYQMMYLKLMRSLCEPIIEHENRLNEPAREILVLSLEALIKKLQVIADHYLPTLSTQLGKVSSKKEIQYPPISPQKDSIVSPQKESLAETRTDSKDADAADTKTTDSNQLPQWQDQPPPVTPSDCRNMIKYIFLPVQEITSKLAKCHVTEETSMYSERQLFEQFFVQSIRCLEIFKIVLAAASAQPSQVSAQLKSSLAKDEKETVETFALVFYDADPKLFRYIFGRQINFFIDAFIANTSVQLVCKFLTLGNVIMRKLHQRISQIQQRLNSKTIDCDKTFTSTGSILMKHMLKHMSELGVSGQISSNSSTSDKTNVYLRLFREIFHIVSGLNNDQQPQRVSVTATERQARSKEHEAMLIPYLHQIVSDSIQLALRSRDPNHYFALLHALFRSIGTGSHDQLYQQFLPLLPSILQQLNRFQNGSYRQPIHDLYVELCLTVPVRLSSLLPYLPKLMDPLVCALNGTSKLVMQGLRTLELFVNNLQLDYIYDQMLPVRAALMQGIWRALYTQELHYAMLALKILGKLGGSSRRAFMDPQNFTYVDLEDIGRSIGPRALYAAGHASYDCEPPKLCVQTELTITQKPDTTTKPIDTGPQKRKLDNGAENEETASKKQQLDEEKTEPIAAESETKEATEQTEQVTEEPKVQVIAELPMAQLVDSALTMIRSSMVNEPTPALNLNWAHWIAAAPQFITNTQSTPGKVPKQQAVELCKTIVLQSIKESPLLKLHSEEKLKPLFQKAMQTYNERKKSGDEIQQKQSYQCENPKARAVIGSALTGLFYAAVSSELRPQSLSVYRAIVSHLTLQALLESMAVDLSELEEQMEVDGQAPLQQQPRDLLDASILIDVICQTLSDSCKHFAQAGIVALRFINIIIKSLFDTPEELNQAYELPFFDVLLKRIHQLSCRRDWFCKLGGCTALRFFVDNFTREFVLRNVDLFMQSFFTTISGLADEVSYGAVDVACKAMDQLIDVCAGVNEDEKRDFDAHSLHKFVQLVSTNLTNAEQQIRAEVNRLLVRLLELTGKTKLELLGDHVEHLKQVLLSGFVKFSSMSIGSQLGLLDFIHQHLIDLQLVTDPSYADQSLAFVSNLMTIIENTDIALHSMPSSRYSITNLPGGSHSLEDQMRFLRAASLQALGQHSLALLSLKQKLEQSISSDELKMERLNLALSAIDLDQIQIDTNGNSDKEKQLERMRWTLRYASQLANVQFDECKKQPTRTQMNKLKNQLKEMIKNLKIDSDLVPNSQSAQRQRLIEKLDAIVEFLLKLTIHPVHPQKLQCRDLLEKILTNEPRFKLRIHTELARQFQQMQPFAMLNNEVENPVTYLEDSLNAKDRMSFLAHSIVGDDLPQHIRTVSDGTGDGIMNDSGANSILGYQPPTLICVDLNDPTALGALLEGQLSVQLKDQDGKVLAVGETIAFAPVTEKSKHKVRQPSESALIRHTKELADFVNEEEDQPMEETQSTDETTLSKNFTPIKQEVFVIVGRKNNRFRFARYYKKIPPEKPGTFITITTCASGQQIRTIRNYTPDMLQEEKQALQICQQIEERVEEAAEIQRQQDYLLSDTLDHGAMSGGQRYSMSFNEEVDEATKAHLQEVANMLMADAYRLGLDQPSYAVTVRPGNVHTPPKRRTSSGMSASELQELMDMSDTDLREIGEEIIQNLPDFRSPEKQQQDFIPQQGPSTATIVQEPYLDPVQEVVASMRAAAQKQNLEASGQNMEAPPVTTTQYELPPPYMPTQTGQYTQQAYQPITHYQQPQTSGAQMMQQPQQMSQQYSQVSSNSPMPMYQQHQFVQQPITPGHYSIQQHSTMPETQHHEQENGLDAEYTMGQSHAQVVHSDYSMEHGDTISIQQPEIKLEEMETHDEQHSEEINGIPDRELSEYLVVQTNDAWKPSVTAHVPVKTNNRLDFSRAQIAVDSALNLNKEEQSNEDEFNSQLDEEPLMQQTNEPLNPVLLGENGQQLETELTDEKIDENEEEESSEDDITTEQVTDMIDDKEVDLKSKQQEEESDQSSENSFEFVTIDNDHLPCMPDTKANKRDEVSRKLEQVLKDHKRKKPVQKSSSRSSSSKAKPKIVLNIPNAAQLQNVEIDPKALNKMRKMTKPKSKSKKKSSKSQKVKFFLKNKPDDPNIDKFNIKEDANADPELMNAQAAEGPYAHVTNDKLRLFLHRLHKKSPKRAQEAVDYYVRRMTDLLQKTYKPKVETETDVVRVEFAHESIRLPTGHLISTMPRVHFNYLPDDVFADLQTFDEVEDEMRKEVNALADKLRTHPTLLDDDLEKLFEYQSVNSTKLDALASLRSLVNARIPPRLLSYLVGEVGQLFKLDLNGGELNEEHVQQLKTTLWLMTNLEQQRPIDFLLNSLSFVAELNESLDLQEQIDDLLRPLTTCLSLEAPKIIKHILSPSFLGVLSCRRIAQIIFEREEAFELRSEFFNQLELVEELLDFKSNTDKNDVGNSDVEKSKDFEMSDETHTKDEEVQQQDVENSTQKPQVPARNQRSQVQIDCFLLRLMQIFAKHSRDQFIGNERLINLVHSFWKSDTIESRYSTHQSMNETDEQVGVVRQYFDSMLVSEKFEVPELCVRLMIDYMREHQDRIDLLFDCCIAFCHEYVTDFTFLTRYIEEDIVPVVPLEWRHNAYDRLINFFQPKRSDYPDKECILLAKFTQHILMPAFQHAFNTQPMDDVVGAKPWPDNDENEQSIIWKFCHNIIEPYYNSDSQACALQLPVPEALKVVLYQFCSILVQRCPDHIHSTTGRKQQRPTGTPKPSDKCLRSLMLFCWHCIQNQQPIELPEKYAGQFLIANLMEKFAISKSIINQAVASLLAAHQQDLRVIVSKSLEIIIPVIAGRGDDGDIQLFETIKKTIEESQQHSQIVHCIAILTKHAKVFFRVRQQVADLLIHSIQRFHSTQASLENKKLILEICETILKFETQRNDLLEKAQTQDPPTDKIQQTTPLPAIELENIQQTFDRRVIDQILQWLLRIATSTDQTALMQNHPGGDPYSLVRKALGILRRAIKPQIFGNIPLRTTHLERQLGLLQQRTQPHEELSPEQQTLVYNQVSQTLDIILAMISYLPPDSINDFMHGLQRPISLCVSCTNMAVAQSCFKLVGKLAEQSASNARSSLADYEILNAEIGRYLNDSMNFIASSGFSQQLTPTLSMQLISKCLALLRVICKFHPTYLEQTCFVTFLKMFQKLVFEYNPMLPLQTGPPNAVDPRQKIPQDLCSCMDLLKGRLHALSMESRRAIDKELQALVDKPIFGRLKDPNHQTNAPVRRVVEKLMEMLIELVRLDAGCLLAAPMGLKLLTHVYERMHAYDAQYPSDIMLKFLSAIQLVFEDKALRKCELTEKLHVPFFWGLAQIDQNVWYNFFRLFETQFPNQMFERLMHIISEQNWLPLSNRFWIPHCIHLLLRSATTAETSSLQFKNCGTFARTASRLQTKLELEFEDDPTEFVQPKGETVENQQSTETPVQATGANATDNASSLDSNSQIAPAELFNSGKTLQDMLQNSTNADLSRQVAEMSQVDHRLAATIFGDLFSSLWNQMPSQGVEKRKRIAEFFIQSGQFATSNQMPLTPMHCFYVAVQKCTVPVINVDSALLEHLAVDHRLWFEAVDELEQRLRHADSARRQMLTAQSYTQQMKEMDNLSSIYTQLGEEDLRAALWKKRACVAGSFRSIELFNQSLFKEARLQCRLVMNEGKEKMFEDALIGPQRKPQPVVEMPQQPSTSTTEQTPNEPSTSEVKEEPMEEQAETSQQDPTLIQQQVKTPEQPEVVDEQPKETIEEPQPEIIAEHLDIRALDLEMRSLEGVWIQCCRELNDWSALTRYANCNDIANAELLGDAAWHQSEWGLVRDLVPQLEASGSRRGQFVASLLYALSLAANGEFVQRPKVDELSAYLINDWRQLPSLVTPAHMNLVRMAQRVQELAEANQVNKVAVEKIVRIQPGVHQMSTPSKQFPALITHRYAVDAELINCIKQTVKTWRNRPLTIIDPASHWSDTFTWRVQQYWSIMRMFENADNTNIAQQSQAMHPLHSISQAQIQYARTLRKNELFEEAAHELSMLHAMSQVHPIDAGITLHEQVKCLVGLAEKIRRQRKYGEKCLIDSSNAPSPPYLRIKKEPEELIESAINLLDSARLDVLSNDQLARLLAVKASIHSQFNEQNEQMADELFATSANLIENSTTTTGTQSTSVTNTMAASQLVWKYWSNHWERKFNRVFSTIWTNGELNIDACRNARHIALETMTTLLECMRTATDSRAKKFTARFFHFLRSAHALEELLTSNGHSIELEETEEMANEQDGNQIKTITTETVLQKHAGAVSPINWLFWLEQIIHEIRVYSSKEMAKILSTVAESYPQQVLVVLRSAIWPELITQRIKFVQERLPLISDWIQCAPPLDVTGGTASTEQTNGEQQQTNVSTHPYERLQAIEKLEKHEEQFASALTLWRARRRDRQLANARNQLIKFNQAFKAMEEKTSVNMEARKRLESVKQQLKLKYLRLKQMKKLGILPEVPERIPRCLNMAVYEDDGISGDEEVSENDTDVFETRLKLPQVDPKKPFNILIDTSNVDSSDYELQIDLQMDKTPELALPQLVAESTTKNERLEPWTELLLQAVDSMCIGRYADVNALNAILNDLDQISMPWMQLVHSELVQIADFVHGETSKLAKKASNAADLKASEQICLLMDKFNDQILLSSNQLDQMEVDQQTKEEKLRQEMISELLALKQDQWPLLKLSRLLCQWLQKLEKELNGLDEIVPICDIAPYLSSFNSKVAYLDVCSAWSPLKTQFATQISQFLPLCRRQFRPSGTVLIFGILSQNGKTYVYRMERRSLSIERQRSQQLLNLLNYEFLTNREVCRRSVQFSLPDVFHTGRNYQIMECNPMSGAPTYQLFKNVEQYGSNLKSLHDIAYLCWRFDRQNNGQEPSMLWKQLEKQFEQMELGQEIESTPENNQMLSEFIRNTYPDSATHWIVRKKFVMQWALYAAAELAAGLSCMNLKEMHMDFASAQLFCTGYSFDLKLNDSGDLTIGDGPFFRLTSNLAEYMQVDIEQSGDINLPGHLTGCFTAATRALATRSYSAFLHALFWDLCELKLPSDLTKAQKAEKLLKATQELPHQLAERLKSLAVFTEHNFKAVELLEQSANKEFWKKLPISQHSWF